MEYSQLHCRGGGGGGGPEVSANQGVSHQQLKSSIKETKPHNVHMYIHDTSNKHGISNTPVWAKALGNITA